MPGLDLVDEAVVDALPVIGKVPHAMPSKACDTAASARRSLHFKTRLSRLHAAMTTSQPPLNHTVRP
jgi:hypothetical protein